jgi:hypothetical protein
MYDTRKYSISDLAEPFSIPRPAVYRIRRSRRHARQSQIRRRRHSSTGDKNSALTLTAIFQPRT